VRQDDRQRMIANAALVDEVPGDALHDRPELREPIDGLFLPAPVELGRPVVDQRAQFPAISSECPSLVDFVRPPSPPQPILKVVECALGYVDEELFDVHHFSS